MSLLEKLNSIQNNVPQVHQAGKDQQNKVLWDFYQQEGQRTDYLSAFSGVCWNSDTFKPMHNIKPTLADMMFFWFNFPVHPFPEEMPQPLDLVEHCKAAGITLDFSVCTQMWRAFSYAYVSRVGVIDFANCRCVLSSNDADGNPYPNDETRVVYPTKWGSMFHGSYITTIDKLIFYTWNPPFDAKWLPEDLVNVTCEGEIFYGGLDMSVCPNLTKESIMQFINCLTDLNNAGYNQTVIANLKAQNTFVVTLGADHMAKLTDEEKAIATNKGWTLA